MPRIAMISVTDERMGRESYQALADGLDASFARLAEASGWTVDRLAAGVLGERGLQRAADGADAVVLMGGEDVHPSFYGGALEYEGGGVHEERADAAQIALVHRALETGTPLLGICRGQQIVNVALGGGLHQHIGYEGLHRQHPETGGMVEHGLAVVAGGALDGLALRPVRSSHHQSVSTLGSGLRVAATAEDGVVEALEHESGSLVTVQWHPEHPLGDAAGLDALLGLLARERALVAA